MPALSVPLLRPGPSSWRHPESRAAAAAPVGASSVVQAIDGPVGAYLHVPFCERICPFCPYNKVVAEPELARRYFAALRREVDSYVSAHTAQHDQPFTSLYVGGGTPTLYPHELAELVALIPVTGEVAIEVLPNHGTSARLDELALIGFTAVSIGAQSFHDDVLRQLRRPHDAATSRAAVANALGRFSCVDVDLIVDVAWDDDPATRGAFLADVRTCFKMGVDQVSTYPLMRFGYTPFGTAHHHRLREHALLGEVARLAGEMGYERRSVWTFNRQGSDSYTSITRRRFLGMGAGSSTFAGRDFYVNHFGVGTYCDAVDRGELPVARWFHLGALGGSAYDAFWQAYAGGVDLPALEHSYGSAAAAAYHVALAALARAGAVYRTPAGYALTARGFDLYHDLERAVTYHLIEPLWAEMLKEHAAESACPLASPHSQPPAGATSGRAHWARPDRGRVGKLWPVSRRLYERRFRPVASVGEAGPNSLE